MRFNDRHTNMILHTNEIHKGELYSPLCFSDDMVIETSVDQATTMLCHSMDVCEVTGMVSVANVKLTDDKFAYCISNELHEAKETWFLIQGSCFDDSELKYLIINEKEQIYPLYKFDKFDKNMLALFIMSKHLLISKLDLVSDNTSLELILKRGWMGFSAIDKMLIIKAIGLYLRR